jgi:hypothetical protein
MLAVSPLPAESFLFFSFLRSMPFIAVVDKGEKETGGKMQLIIKTLAQLQKLLHKVSQ